MLYTLQPANSASPRCLPRLPVYTCASTIRTKPFYVRTRDRERGNLFILPVNFLPLPLSLFLFTSPAPPYLLSRRGNEEEGTSLDQIPTPFPINRNDRLSFARYRAVDARIVYTLHPRWISRGVARTRWLKGGG